MASIPAKTLPSGDALPVVGFGTWDQDETDVHDALPVALDHGYTHVDTAEGYQNEAAIGEVLAEYDREDLFLTSKVLPSNLHYGSVLESLSASLQALGLDALDLFDWTLDTDAIARLDDLDRGQNVYQLELDDEIYGIPA